MGRGGAQLGLPSPPLLPLLLLRLAADPGAALVPHAVALAVQGDVHQLVQPVPQGPTPTVGGAGPHVLHHAVLHVVVVDVAAAAVSLEAAVVLLSTARLLPVELQSVSRLAQRRPGLTPELSRAQLGRLRSERRVRLPEIVQGGQGHVAHTLTDDLPDCFEKSAPELRCAATDEEIFIRDLLSAGGNIIFHPEKEKLFSEICEVGQ